MSKTVLVTGGTGYVGGWCIVELLRHGEIVRTTIRSLAKEAGLRAAVASQVQAGDRLTVCAADLMDDAGWDEAVAGCDYVLHVASPMSGAADLTTPARDGALRVLRAAVRAGVRRVVLTSSTAACTPPLDGPGGESDETVWSDPNDPSSNEYRRSKVLAERAARDFMAENGGKTEFVTVLPTAIFGPVLSGDASGSVQVIGGFLTGRMAGIPKRGFNIVDVRDLADAHIRAMTAPEAAGQRFIAGSDFMWMAEIARLLRARLGPRASKVPKRVLPNFVVRWAARRNPALAGLVVGLGKRNSFSSAKARRVLGWTPRSAAETVIDCAESLMAKGALKA